MANFPTSLPVAGSASSTATLQAAGHTALHNNAADEIRAVASKIGTGSSTPASGLVLRGSGAGTSSWAQVALSSDVTGTLPVANGGTGVGTSTGSGSVVLSTAPSLSSPTLANATATNSTLVTPTIASFTNAQHNHSNAAGGGLITESGLNLSKTTDANGWVVRNYGNWKTYEKTYTAAVAVDSGQRSNVATSQALPVGVTDVTQVRWQGVYIGTFGGHVITGLDTDTTTPGTVFAVTLGNQYSGGTLTFTGRVYVTLRDN